jgi:hypothetical protein
MKGKTFLALLGPRLEHFVPALESASEEASAIIIYIQLKPGFSAGGDLRDLYAYALAVTPAERISRGNLPYFT